eukprot:4094979-Prymnesium_polylepis.2
MTAAESKRPASSSGTSSESSDLTCAQYSSSRWREREERESGREGEERESGREASRDAARAHRGASPPRR